MNKLLRLPVVIGALFASLFVLFACHLSNPTGTEETFTFPTLKDSVKTADSVLILLKAPNGQVIDTLFHDKITSVTSFVDLKAPHYTGGPVLIVIEAVKDGKLIYKVERGFDPAQGGDLPDSKIIYVTPSLGLRLDRALSKLREGESVPLPEYSVVPTALQNKSVLWTSRNPAVLKVEGSTVVGVTPGTTYLIAALVVDTTKKDSLLIEVISKTAPVKPIDSLVLQPDTLVLALGGTTGRFTVKPYPATVSTVSTEATWFLLEGASVKLAPDGLLSPVAEGLSRIAAASKLDSTVADTAWVRVLPKVAVDSVRFTHRALDLFAGGAAEVLQAKAHPALAPQGLQFSVLDTGVARLTGSSLQGRIEGETWVHAASTDDPSKKDSLRVTVFPSEKVDSVRLVEDSLVLYYKGVTGTLNATIHPATLQKRFQWRSGAPLTATVDANGLVTPGNPGKTYVTVLSRADSTRKDSALIVVKQDFPRLKTGGDTLVAKGSTVTHLVEAPQDYGVIVMFKWDLNGDGAFDDSSATLRSSLSALYADVKVYTIRFYVRDTEGNEVTILRKVTAVSGRVVQIIEPKDGAYVNTPSITVTWNVDNQPQSNTQALTAGANTVTRSAQDSAGTAFSHSITVHLDQAPPTRPTVKGPTLPVNTLTPRWSWATGGNGGSGVFRFRVDNPDLTAQPTTTDTFHTASTNLNGGVHTLYAQERDLAGNWAENGSHPIRIDTTAPGAPAVSIVGSSPTREMRPTWTWTGGAGDAHRYYRYKLDNDDFRSGSRDTVGTSFRPGLNLENGSHTLYVQERDTAGNWSQAGSALLVIDTVRPAAPTVSGAALTNDDTPTWTWTTASSGTVQFRHKLDNADLTTGTTTTSAKEFTPAAALSEGIRTLYVQEGDAAGNWSNTASRAIRIDVTRPTPPRIDSTPYSPLNSLRPRLTWRSGTGGMKIFRARFDNVDLSSAVEQSDSSFTPSSDLLEGLRSLYVQERDSAGNWSQISERKILLAQERILGTGPVSNSHSIGGQMAFNKAGLLFISYTEIGQDSTVAVRYFQNGNWINPGQTGRRSGMKPSLAIDSRDNIYLGYIWPTFSEAEILRFNGSFWDHYSYGFREYDGYDIELAFDGLDSLYFSFKSNNRASITKKLRQSQWDTLGGIIRIRATGEFQTAFTVSKAAQPFLAIQVSSYLDVYRYTGSSWEMSSAPGSDILWPYHLAMTTTNFGEPIVANQDSERKLSVSKLANGGWQTVGNTGISDGLISKTALATSPTGEQFIAYFETVLGANRLTVAKLIGASWVKVGVPYITPESEHLSLIIDAAGIPYVSFQDGNRGGAITVLRKSFN